MKKKRRVVLVRKKRDKNGKNSKNLTKKVKTGEKSKKRFAFRLFNQKSVFDVKKETKEL